MPSARRALFYALVYATLARAVQTFFPPSIPLAVRSPYLNTWQNTVNGSQPLSNAWPQFWTMKGIMGWTAKIRVDAATYTLMGNDGIANSSANVTDIQITPTRSVYLMQAGPMNVNLTFFSPIEPSDWVKQSIPFSYMSVVATSADGNQHSVQVYSDISAEWLSGNRSDFVRWSPGTSTGSSFYHEIEVQDPQSYVQIADQAQDGKAYYAMASTPGMSWQIEQDTTTRNQFRQEGVLTNAGYSAFGVMGPPWPIFAISVDLGNVQSTSDVVTWAIGYVRNPTIQYSTATGDIQNRMPYYTTQYNDIGAVIDAFTNDFPNALSRAEAFDSALMGNASKISSNYVDLVSLNSRQVMASLDITVANNSEGKVDPTDVIVFMKDIGSSERVNPVEHMFAAFPMYLYLNTSLCGAMLRPLLEFQNASTIHFATKDMGVQYPVASGDQGTATLGVEESGNMLIMMYAHARFSGDGTLLRQYYNVTTRWADYLFQNALTPQNQQIADGETASNITNLAFKGILGVKAMAEIARAVGESDDLQHYDGQADALLGQWQSLVQSSGSTPHILGRYNEPDSWALMYNIYADILLGTNLMSQNLLEGQTAFYGTLTSTTTQFGPPSDSDSGSTANAAWTLLTSATVTDNSVRDMLIGQVWKRASSNLTTDPFPNQYDDQTGQGSSTSGTAGPALGAMYAHLALTLQNTTINVPPPGSTGTGLGGNSPNGDNVPSNKSHAGAIAGGVIGGLAALGLALGLAFYLRRRNRLHHSGNGEKTDMLSEPHRPTLAYQDEPAGLEEQANGEMHTTLPVPFPREEPQTSRGMSKARERQINMYVPSLSASSTIPSGSASELSSQPLSPGMQTLSHRDTMTNSSISPTEVLGLRAEVENLRRVMQVIRTERLEPPPEYHEEFMTEH